MACTPEAIRAAIDTAATKDEAAYARLMANNLANEAAERAERAGVPISTPTPEELIATDLEIRANEKYAAFRDVPAVRRRYARIHGNG